MIYSDFPILKKVIYLDNAATTLKPKSIIKKMSEFYLENYANVHRGIYKLSEIATEYYEKSREKIAKFLGVEPYQIFFTKNATEGLNFIAWNFRSKVVGTTIKEHHSVLLPIMKYAKIKLSLKEQYILTHHASNVLGTIQDIRSIRDDNPNSIIAIDGSQYVPHNFPDLKKLDIDAYVFSGHKLLGPSGIGVVYLKNPEEWEPMLLGGGTVSNVTIENYILVNSIEKFEAGTPPIAEAYGLSLAMDYLKNIQKRDINLTMQKLIDEFKIYPINRDQQIPIYSFYFKGIHAHDVAYYLDRYNIAVRAGFHCAQPLHEYMNIGPTTRASFYFYNNKKHALSLMEALSELIKKYGFVQ